MNENAILDALRTVNDPEIHHNVVELGLIYDIQIQSSTVHVKMTLTTPACPLAPQIVTDARQAVLGVEGVESAEVELVYDPPWSPMMMTDEAKLALGYDL